MARYSNYSTLVSVEAAVNGIVIIVSLFGLIKGVDGALVPPQLLIGTSLIALGYFAIGHGAIRRRSEYISALIMTILSSLNCLLLIIGTGGFESPYFVLWLGIIMVTGLFGWLATTGIVLTTLGALAVSWSQHSYASNFIIGYIPQIIGVLAAAALIEILLHGKQTAPDLDQKNADDLQNKLTEESLKASALVNAMADAVIVIDGANKISLMNQTAAYTTGWSTHSAIGLDYHSVLKLLLVDHSGQTQPTDPLAQTIRDARAVTSSDILLSNKQGQSLHLAITASSLGTQPGQNHGAVLVLRDITKQKELDRQKDEFISTASHEMRTPVAAIEGYLSLAMNPKVATLDDRARKLLQKAHDSTGHLGSLFRDLLSITKMEDGTKKLPREAVNLSEMVKSVVSDMQFVAASKKLSLTIAGSALPGTATIDQALYVMANPERLREVVMNLIENAIKYTPSGSITVTTKGNGQTVDFSVTDTGPGIAPEDQPHLFEKFYRVAKTANAVSGTGLGLYLCRSVIESFGGHVTLSSTPGQGSTFGFSLPQLSTEQVAKAQRDKAVLIQPTV